MQLANLAFSTIFKRRGPKVIVTDLQSSVSDLTTYTFSNCNIGPLSGNPTRITAAADNDNQLRSSQRGYIICIVHAEDALTNFNVTGVTLGGVVGGEIGDVAGAVLCSTAIYRWAIDAIGAIPNTDIVVTMSEAVTSCAIGLLYVSNVGIFTNNTNAGASGAGDLSVNPGNGSLNFESGSLVLFGMTCVTGGGTELPVLGINTISGLLQPTLLYHGSNAEMDYAAGWTYNPGIPGNEASTCGLTCSWSGAGNGDLIAANFL